MKIFTCTDHHGLWPVGVASIVIAQDEAQARTLLDEELKQRSLLTFADHPYELIERKIDPDTPKAIILQDGDY